MTRFRNYMFKLYSLQITSVTEYKVRRRLTDAFSFTCEAAGDHNG